MNFLWSNWGGSPIPDQHRATFERVARDAKADQVKIVVWGYTHIPMQALNDGVWIFNPGAVIAAGSRSCAVLSLPEYEFEVIHIDTKRAIDIDLLKI